ncbi:MAG: imidazole glycerol phosphate synthase subunit HisH, partial [Chlamydiia bacterium]|nr:imidazole glycerol phosphate synthase subunit HisH [Chlamydiia bacterium]
IVNMLKRLRVECTLSSDPSTIVQARRLILPGVGHYDAAVRRLRSAGLWSVLDEKVRNDHTPILGICLGMQLLTRGSEEGDLPGFGWIPATVKRFQLPEDSRLKVPHMGWNVVHPCIRHPLFAGFENEMRFYFVHSYYAKCEQSGHCLGETTHGLRFASILGHQHILGVQFHPEKSHRFGMQLLRNYIDFSGDLIRAHSPRDPLLAAL